ncbi:MAG: YkvI family membrane protein [Bacillota bacterium]
MSKDQQAVLQITTTYIGAVIGAGFASGQEILQFFSRYQAWGYLGVILYGILFAVVGYLVFSLSLKFKLYSYDQLFYWIDQRLLGLVSDLSLLFFLLASFVVMLSGSGEILFYYFGLAKNWGIILSILVVIWAISFGIKGVMRLNLILIPGLIVVIIATFILNLEPRSLVNLGHHSTAKLQSGSWFYYAINYFIYNFFLALPVLTALPTQIKDRGVLKRGSYLAGLILASLGLVINSLLVQNLGLVEDSQLPMLELLYYKSASLYLIYSLILLMAMLTTATSSCYGLVMRLRDKVRLDKKWLLISIAGVGFFLAKFNFAALVAVVYPLLGNLGGVLSLSLMISYFKRRIII